MPGKAEGRRREQRIKWLGGIAYSMDMSLSKFQKIVKDRKAWCATVHAVTKSWTRLSNGTTTPKKKEKRLNESYCLGASGTNMQIVFYLKPALLKKIDWFQPNFCSVKLGGKH